MLVVGNPVLCNVCFNDLLYSLVSVVYSISVFLLRLLPYLGETCYNVPGVFCNRNAVAIYHPSLNCGPPSTIFPSTAVFPVCLVPFPHTVFLHPQGFPRVTVEILKENFRRPIGLCCVCTLSVPIYSDEMARAVSCNHHHLLLSTSTAIPCMFITAAGAAELLLCLQQ